MSNLIKTIDVSSYGAKGDGVADDTTAISNAIAAAPAGGVVVFAPGKTYKTTSQISIGTDGITLSGYGAVITSATDSQFRKFLFSGRARGAVMGLRFECLYTSADTGLGEGVIEIGSSSDVTVKDCEFNDVAKNGVYVWGDAPRCRIESNRFYRNFNAIFMDDDGGGGQPSYSQIINNQFRTGINTDGFSGAIKISGIAGSIFSNISSNQIDSAGEMGIEVQGPDDFTIGQNNITGTVYGISVSESDRAAITGNVVKYCSSIAIEVASNTNDISIFGNVVRQNDHTAIWVVSSSRRVTITANRIHCETSGSCIYLQNGPAEIQGNYFSGVGSVYLHNSSDVCLVGNVFDGDVDVTFAAIWFDAADADMGRCIVTNNRILGNYGNSAIMLYSPAGHKITDLLISNNTTAGCAPFAADAFNSTSVASGHYALQRIRCFDNFYSGTADNFNSLSVPTFNNNDPRSYTGFGWNKYFYFEGATIKHNTSVLNAPIGWEMVNASGLGGYTQTHVKTDSSSNPVLISGYSFGGASQTIAGQSHIALTQQWATATFRADGNSNWMLVSSGRF